MQQPQYYKTVRVSERKPPPEVELIFIPEEEAPVFGRFRTVGKTEYVILLDSSGEEEAYFYNDYVHWLEPIPIPDAALLRSALEKILACRTSCEICQDIAREALSNTSDGWVRVEDGLPERSSRMCWATYKEGEKIHVIEVMAEYIAVNPKTYLHWQYQQSQPSPPQPINP